MMTITFMAHPQFWWSVWFVEKGSNKTHLQLKLPVVPCILWTCSVVSMPNSCKLNTYDQNFLGAGGISEGLHRSGVATTCWAVDYSSSACQTFQSVQTWMPLDFYILTESQFSSSNHPDTIVYNQDTNSLLQHTVENPAEPCFDLRNERLPPMPKPGEVDIIVGGPPCQAFSGSNRQKVSGLLSMWL